MHEWIIVFSDGSGSDIIKADAGYESPTGALRFFNKHDKYAIAQYAPGQWRNYRKKVCDVCKN